MSKRWPDKYIVGLTGNIATGKSAVMEMAANRGALAIDADRIVHYLMENDAEVQHVIEAAFGPDVQDPDKKINREKLGAIVFNSEDKLTLLESIVHPAVRRALLTIIDDSEERIIFIEAIKLLESSLAKECDQIWVTRCPRQLQIERLVTYRGMDEKTAAQRVSAQSPEDQKVAAADVVIDTVGSMADTVEFFDLAWQRLLRIVPGPIAVWQQKRAASGEIDHLDAVVRLSRAAQGTTSNKNSFEQRTFKPEFYSSRTRPLDEQRSTDTTPLKKATFQLAGVTIQRATPSDVPDILWLIRRTSGSAVRTKRRELLMSLGERGYLIGRKNGEISALAGWRSENLVATVDLIIINPPEAAFYTGAAILQEIEDTANELICEVILAFPPTDPPAEVGRLFAELGYTDVQRESLPVAWQTAVEEFQPYDTLILMKVLRDTRAIGPM